ncbi:respiratory nitrate reductase subunit gamma [Vulcanisaeta souniana]|uniref:Nitrate reductase n=1 Tax=Vulcanisaeta souniana JCM 11219 TaxID=1293586 RepID=A0A830E7I8_9CREN|nr:respiratory nitrate reductase subunit gamma [Vulcanisaeta souniana]BDR93471.1 nitrate reductase [Vulcanisaeta souniana JCM 11219]GGI77412.1 nitrate reductase [Vulcanisaeta souniana JCM 11219]
MNELYLVLYGYIPYAVVMIFLVGIIYRVATWITAKGLVGLYNANVCLYRDDWGSTMTEVLKRIFIFYTLPGRDRDWSLFIGSFLFHWGIWIALIGHLGIVIPGTYLERWFGLTPSLHQTIALYVGGTAGTIALIGLLILIVRRIAGRTITVRVMGEYKVRIPLRMFSFLDDYFAVAILLAIIVLGLYQTLGITPYNPAYVDVISKWMWSLVMLHPNIQPIINYPILQVHALLAMVFIAYFPWSKMMHPFSFLFMPTIARPAIKVKTTG